ncbi:hypothetical protein [Streptomyces sp. NPDC000229]|uniref:hypothetical protein n=1 Tax=Streptomyces sp. NPDC000229 TaxID=3154247 RepID=UPI00331A08AC
MRGRPRPATGGRVEVDGVDPGGLSKRRLTLLRRDHGANALTEPGVGSRGEAAAVCHAAA